MSLVLAQACKRTEPTPISTAEKDATQAALDRFQLPPDQSAQVELWLSGAEDAAIARDKRTGMCLVLSASDGRWQPHGLFKGAPSATDLAPPLKSAGTLQEGVTRADLQQIADTHCR